MKNKILSIFAFAATALTVISCGSEDELTPTDYNDNPFAVSTTATDEESVLRRDFYDHTGIYLLFTDTLSHEYIGKNDYGEDVWETETIDPSWSVTGNSTVYAHYGFIKSLAEKRVAAKAIEQYFVPHIKGSSYSPFSILLLDSLETSRYGYEDEYETAGSLSSTRCLYINVGGIGDMDEDEIKEQMSDILAGLVSDRVSGTYDNLSEFYNMTENMTGVYADGEYFRDLFDSDEYSDDTTTDEEAQELALQYGYLTFHTNWRGRRYFPYDGDYESFFEEVWKNDPEGFESKYADYPVVIAKYEWLRKYIISTGYNF